MTRRFRFNFALPLALLLAFVTTLTCSAQQNSEITGTVADNQGAVVPNAHVTLTQPSTGLTREADTNASGYFDFAGLNIGSYTLKITATGFQTSVKTGLELNVSQTLRSDVSMTVGSVDTTVSVETNALQVQTDSNVVSTLINADQITEIATENRNFVALVALGLGVSSTVPDSNTPSSIASNFNISVNGLRESHNIWLIDGGEADDRGAGGGASIMPSQDAIAQFETLSSNYPPDYGISSGATISMALKSGTQKLHGSLWEFNRNAVYDANTYFNNQSGKPRTKLNYNIYGFNVGGPIFIPKVYNANRERTFFFWNEEWRKIVQGSAPNPVNTLPTQDFPVAGQDLHYVPPPFGTMKDANGNVVPVQIIVPNVKDPAYIARVTALGLTEGQPFPTNPDGSQNIPASLLDNNAILYLNNGIVPKPNGPNGQNVSSANQPLNIRDDVFRIDHKINDKYQLLGHYIADQVTQTFSQPMLGWSGATYPTITSTLQNPSNSAVIKLTDTISPNLLAEASFNYDGNVIHITNSANSLNPAGWTVNPFFANGSKNLPNMNWGGFYNTQENPGSAPWNNAARDYSPNGSLYYAVGKHQFKFGGGYNRYTKNQQLFGDPGGGFTWGTLSRDSFVDMILGLASTYDQAQRLPHNHYVNQTTSAYVMDNWHPTPRLSVQLGIRYDALPHAYERNNQISNFDPSQYLQSSAATFNDADKTLNINGPGFQTVGGTAFYTNGLYNAGSNGYPKGLVTNDYSTIQPRVGFSADIFGHGKTVVRGGIGSFYERVQGNDIYNTAANEPYFNDPKASSVYLSNPHTSFTDGNTAALPNFAQGLTSLARTYKAPGVVQYSLGVQHEIRPSVVLVVQYVGNLAWHQQIQRNINNYSLNTPLTGNGGYNRANAGDPGNNSGTNPGGSSIPIPDRLRNFVGFGSIVQQEDTTNGGYNGFQTGLRAQNKHGLTGEVDYTWSHEIDINSFDNANISNPYNLKYDKGSGALDRRNILSINYVYKLPLFNRSTGLTHSVAGGWELAGTFIGETGTIISNQGVGLSVGYDTVGLGGGYINRPDINGKVHYTKVHGKQWFDPSVFSAPVPVWAGGVNQGFGSARKDAVVGPGRANFTTSLYKSFAIREGINFKFRLESFNTFNHTQFSSVSSTFGGGNFGNVNGTYDPRVLELGGQLTF